MTVARPNARERLPNRRPSVTFPFEVGGQHYRATISCFADGRVAEIFLANHKSGSQADANCRDAAVAASLALQFGCPLDVLRNALLRDIRGMAATPLGAVLDLVAEQEGTNSGTVQ
jgi:ribonucleoside-diphosphate reductase alpha chain